MRSNILLLLFYFFTLSVSGQIQMGYIKISHLSTFQDKPILTHIVKLQDDSKYKEKFGFHISVTDTCTFNKILLEAQTFEHCMEYTENPYYYMYGTFMIEQYIYEDEVLVYRCVLNNRNASMIFFRRLVERLAEEELDKEIIDVFEDMYNRIEG